MNFARTARVSRRARRTTARGFTLVELMVALTGGLFVSIAVFMLAKQATGIYQSEARMSNATLSSVVGFDRLRADIERAGYLCTPNVRYDPNLATAVDSTWPAYLAHLQSIFIQQTPTTLLPVQTGNGLAPDQITLAGSFASAEEFWVDNVSPPGGSSTIITLQTKSGAMARLHYADATTAADKQALLLSVFGPGRALRYEDTEGHDQYGTITAVAGGAQPAVLLSATSPLVVERGSNQVQKRGSMGNGSQGFASVVNIVRYSIQNMSADPNYAPLFSAGTGGAGAIPATDAGRTELVREELDTAGVPLPNTQEIVSEFAVDMAFGVTVARSSSGSTAALPDQLVTLDPGSPTAAYAGDVSTLNPANGGPQKIRAVRARLSVRSREADRPSNMNAASTAVIGPGLFRVGLGANGTAPFARVRTVQADIAIRNHAGVNW